MKWNPYNLTILTAFCLHLTLSTAAASPAQQAYLKASNTDAADGFGRAVFISGDTLVVGGYLEDSNTTGINGDQSNNTAFDSGAAYVFVREGNTWRQQAYLKPPRRAISIWYGESVAISGNTIVVGSQLESSAAIGINGDPFGVGAAHSGAAFVYVRDGTNWNQQAYLKASNAEWYERFGSSVAICGDTIVAGAKWEASNATGVNGNQNNNSIDNAGAAYVFVRDGTNWTQQAYLKASNPSADDEFGYAVGISGDTIVVGAYLEDSNGTGVNGVQNNNFSDASGAAYIFVREGTNWTQQAYLKASNAGGAVTGPNLGDRFGISVAAWGDTVVVGAHSEASNASGVNGDETNNSLNFSGAAYVFARTGDNWIQQAYLKASNPGVSDYFGESVAVYEDTVVVGTQWEAGGSTGINGPQDNNHAFQSGAAYVFVRNDNQWTQQAYMKASNAERGDAFGISVAISGETVLVGAFHEDSNATGVNGNENDNNALTSGSAYVFTGLGPPPPPPPTLAIEKLGSDVRVFWTHPATGYLLEKATMLDSPPIDWTTVQFPYQTNATHISITIPNPAGASYYRLTKP